MELTREQVANGLSGLGKSPVNLKHAFLTLSLPDANIRDITVLKDYPHLQVVELPNNSIEDLSALAAQPHLLRLDASGNRLKKVLDFEPAPFEDNHDDREFNASVGSLVDDADLSNNKIEEIDDLSRHRFLRRLVLSRNLLSRISGVNGLQHLQELVLSNNGITCIEGLEGLGLRRLDLSFNAISKITGLNSLKWLEYLNLQHNSITSLHGLEDCTALNELNMSENKVHHVAEVRRLSHLEVLEVLDLSRNEVCESEHFRLRVLYSVHRLRLLNGQLCSSEEKVKATNLHGADAQNREANFVEHISEVPFVNFMPPYVDEDQVSENGDGDGDGAGAGEGKGEDLSQFADAYVDELLQDAVGGPKGQGQQGQNGEWLDGVVASKVDDLKSTADDPVAHWLDGVLEDTVNSLSEAQAGGVQ